MIHHTPGPWAAHDDDGTGTLPCVLSDKVNPGGNFYVAQCNVFEDAKLIASAPDLLEALELLMDMSPYHTDEDSCECGDGGTTDCEHVKAMRAIKKARGA